MGRSVMVFVGWADLWWCSGAHHGGRVMMPWCDVFCMVRTQKMSRDNTLPKLVACKLSGNLQMKSFGTKLLHVTTSWRPGDNHQSHQLWHVDNHRVVSYDPVTTTRVVSYAPVTTNRVISYDPVTTTIAVSYDRWWPICHQLKNQLTTWTTQLTTSDDPTTFVVLKWWCLPKLFGKKDVFSKLPVLLVLSYSIKPQLCTPNMKMTNNCMVNKKVNQAWLPYWEHNIFETFYPNYCKMLIIRTTKHIILWWVGHSKCSEISCKSQCFW